MCRNLETWLRFASPRRPHGPRREESGDKCLTVSAWSVERVEGGARGLAQGRIGLCGIIASAPQSASLRHPQRGACASLTSQSRSLRACRRCALAAARLTP